MTDREKIDAIKQLLVDYRLGVSVNMDYWYGHPEKYYRLEEQKKMLDSLIKRVSEIDRGEE